MAVATSQKREPPEVTVLVRLKMLVATVRVEGAMIMTKQQGGKDNFEAPVSEAELEKATGGGGAGKVNFNPFSKIRKIDSSSPLLF